MATIVGFEDGNIVYNDDSGLIKKTPVSGGASSFSQLTGMVQQSQISNPSPSWFNVKNYGAYGDTRITNDGVIASATTITSVTAKFTPADIGKVYYLLDEVYGIPFSGPGVITAVTNSTTIVCTGINASRIGQTFNLVWGHDDTVALKAAWAAAEASPTGVTPALNENGMKTVYVPAGGYMFSSRPFSGTVAPGVSLLGDGPRKTVFYPHPSFDFTSISANQGMLWNPGSFSGYTGEIGNFSVFGCYINFTASGSANTYLMGMNGPNFHDVIVEFSGTTAALTSNVGGIYGSVNGVVRNVQAISILTAGASAMVIAGGGGVAFDLFASNSTQNLTVRNINYSAFSGSFLTMVGCFVDEGGPASAPAKFIASTGITCFGCQFYTASNPSGGRAVEVDGTSIIRFEGCTFGPYSYSFTASGGLTVDAGGVVYASDNDFRSNSGGSAIINNGTIYDGLGNSVDAGGISGSGMITQATIAMP